MFHFFRPQRLVFQHLQAAAEQEEQQAEQAERRQTQLSELDQAGLPEEVKVYARQAVLSPSDTRHHLVDRLLNGEVRPEQFMRDYESLVEQEASWEQIFNVQRGIRKRIRELQEKGESYMEMLPRKRLAFHSLVRDVVQLNQADLELDKNLKISLFPLTQPLERQGGQPTLNPVLTQNEAKAIFELDTDPKTNPDYEKNLERILAPLLHSRIPERQAEATRAVNHIRAFKRRERLIEQKMQIATRQLSTIIELNVSRAEREAEKKRMLKEAQKFTGVRLEPGVTLRYHRELRNGILESGNYSARITKVEMKPNQIHDHHGKTIGFSIGYPIIHLSDGQEMTLARFKKWVDAVDAYEDVSSQDELLQQLGWKTLGIPLQPNMQLEYQTYAMDRSGKLSRIPHLVRIVDIRDGKIMFHRPVLYQAGPGLPGMRSDDEYRESLSYGEFLKWWNRQEVEQAFTISELRDKLGIFNKEYNRDFHINPKHNPPISLFQDEDLYYADDPMTTFYITSVSPDRINLSNGESFTPAQFFNWARRNHVQKVPPKEKEPQEAKKEKEEFEKMIAEEEKRKREQETHEKAKEEIRGKSSPEEPKGVWNFFKEAWFKTTFLSVKDAWNMIISIKEFVERKHKRKSQGRYSKVGSKLPGILGTEFRRISQSAETEEVNLNKEAMNQWGIFDVVNRLKLTNDKDVAKACIITLTEKGEMRWDEPWLWKAMNRLTARYTTRGAELYIPTDEHYLALAGKSGEDMIGPALDALWGTGTHAEWVGKNLSTYNNNKNHFEYKGKQLEADPKGTGGLRGEMARLLDAWVNKGEYVSPHEFEELIDFAIKYGKASAEDKFFYMIMGVIAENKNGYGTLLHLDRLGELDGKYLNQFPLLDFFTNKGAKRPDGTIGPWRKQDFHKMADDWFPEDVKRCKPGIQFSKFLWHLMMFDDNFRTRMSKGLRNGEQIDHDDAHLFIPPASYTEIDSITGSPGGGEKKYFTPEGYANAYPGFSQYLISIANSEILAKEDDKRQQSLKDVLKSFVWYDATLDNRFRKEKGAQKARLADHHFNRHSVVDDTAKLSLHRDQLRNLIREIGKEYGMSFEYVFEKTGSLHDPEQARRQNIVEKNIEDRFLREVDELFRRDGGAGVVQAIKQAKDRDANSAVGLRGIRGWTLGNDAKLLKTPEGERKTKEMGLL